MLGIGCLDRQALTRAKASLDRADARLVQARSGPSFNVGIYELYRQWTEEAGGQQARALHRVRLRVPQGIGRMNLLHLNVAADGTLEMTEKEAESFLRAGWEKVDAGGA